MAPAVTAGCPAKNNPLMVDRMTIRARWSIGVGHYLPERVVPNSEFEQRLDTTDEWIAAARGSAAPLRGRGRADLELALARRAPRSTTPGWQAGDIDAMIVATSTADLTFPAAATMVQAALGMTGGFAFDVQAVCAGFVYALTNANALIASQQAAG